MAKKSEQGTPSRSESDIAKMGAGERHRTFGITDAAEFTRPYDRERHDELAAEQGDGKIAGYTEDELRDMLSKTGRIPNGVSFSPYSATPFVELPDGAAEEITRAQREYDATVRGPVVVAGGDAMREVGASGTTPTGSGSGSTGGGGTSGSTGGGGGTSGSTAGSSAR